MMHGSGRCRLEFDVSQESLTSIFVETGNRQVKWIALLPFDVLAIEQDLLDVDMTLLEDQKRKAEYILLHSNHGSSIHPHGCNTM